LKNIIIHGCSPWITVCRVPFSGIERSAIDDAEALRRIHGCSFAFSAPRLNANKEAERRRRETLALAKSRGLIEAFSPLQRPAPRRYDELA
jgi:hypothetical protein